MIVEKKKLVKLLLGMPCDHCIYSPGDDCVDCQKGVEAWVEENLRMPAKTNKEAESDHD